MNSKIEIKTAKAPSPAGPYSQGVLDGDYLFVSGQRPQDPLTGAIPPDIQGQTKQVIQNIESILAEHQCTLADVVKSTVFLSDLANFQPMNEVYEGMFPRPFPARSTIGVQLRGILVEIEVMASLKNRMPSKEQSE